ncbi:hypothetical protein GO986_12395 [Deinococcus sp. HMF7620]|uniref:Uncharacterized protein n=1 Tax=Deinococcus arboris TaxID=2682977 RepID=A0A7C9IBQ8_9DEIO|nr:MULTISPECIES: hypothetical protein [Deinococcus]MBZ9752180.1 hypothetical protein [Deinococcus betulae]MVN87566.1 hypothetical protein [Deinococcus arboris]
MLTARFQPFAAHRRLFLWVVVALTAASLALFAPIWLPMALVLTVAAILPVQTEAQRVAGIVGLGVLALMGSGTLVIGAVCALPSVSTLGFLAATSILLARNR